MVEQNFIIFSVQLKLKCWLKWRRMRWAWRATRMMRGKCTYFHRVTSRKATAEVGEVMFKFDVADG